MSFTREKWLACVDPWGMLKHYHKVRNKSERKVRLLACACSRCIWPLIADERSRHAVEVAEDFADESVTREQFKAAATGASAAFQEARAALNTTKTIHVQTVSEAADTVLKLMRVNVWAGVEDVPIWALGTARTAARKADDEDIDELESPSSKTMPKETARLFARAIYDVLGDPFNPASFDPAWRTEAAGKLARAIYERRDFASIKLLADILHAAGCTNQEILQHCHSAGPHYRGCWVLDSILGKS